MQTPGSTHQTGRCSGEVTLRSSASHLNSVETLSETLIHGSSSGRSWYQFSFHVFFISFVLLCVGLFYSRKRASQKRRDVGRGGFPYFSYRFQLPHIPSRIVALSQCLTQSDAQVFDGLATPMQSSLVIWSSDSHTIPQVMSMLNYNALNLWNWLMHRDLIM